MCSTYPKEVITDLETITISLQDAMELGVSRQAALIPRKRDCTENTHAYDDLPQSQFDSVNNWENIYRESSKYHYIGELKRDL